MIDRAVGSDREGAARLAAVHASEGHERRDDFCDGLHIGAGETRRENASGRLFEIRNRKCVTLHLSPPAGEGGLATNRIC